MGGISKIRNFNCFGAGSPSSGIAQGHVKKRAWKENPLSRRVQRSWSPSLRSTFTSPVAPSGNVKQIDGTGERSADPIRAGVFISNTARHFHFCERGACKAPGRACRNPRVPVAVRWETTRGVDDRRSRGCDNCRGLRYEREEERLMRWRWFPPPLPPYAW